METNLELRTQADKYFDIDKTIDWEQRRYEIAKECLAAQINGLCAAMQRWSYEGEIKSAIYAADELIDQLQKPSEN